MGTWTLRERLRATGIQGGFLWVQTLALTGVPLRVSLRVPLRDLQGLPSGFFPFRVPSRDMVMVPVLQRRLRKRHPFHYEYCEYYKFYLTKGFEGFEGKENPKGPMT